MKSTMEIDAEGNKRWYSPDGFLHRENGPALEQANGIKSWWLNGKRHREDGPAYERADGSKSWYLNGKRHREDGPAIEWADGKKEWWLNGRWYAIEDEWQQALEVYKAKQITDLF